MNAERIFRISREISRENFKILCFSGEISRKYVQIINFLDTYPGEIGNWLKSEWIGEQELIRKQHRAPHTHVFRHIVNDVPIIIMILRWLLKILVG